MDERNTAEKEEGTTEKEPEDRVPYPIARHPGVNEHFLRAVWFFNSAMAAKKVADQFRILVAAAYFARGIAELFIDMVVGGRNELVGGKKALDKIFKDVPYFDLIGRIRIHDFHRCGLVPPSPEVNSVVGLGPVQLVASKGEATIQLTPNGPVIHTTGNSKVIETRPLYSVNGTFYDKVSKKQVSLRVIVQEYLKAMPAAVAECEKLYEPGRAFPTTPEMFADFSAQCEAPEEPEENLPPEPTSNTDGK